MCSLDSLLILNADYSDIDKILIVLVHNIWFNTQTEMILCISWHAPAAGIF